MAGCWVRLTCPEQSLPEQEFLECFLGTRCCERQPVWGCLMSCPRRPSGGAVGTQGWGRGLIPPFQAYPGHHLKRAEVSTVVSVVHSWQVPEMFNASNKVQGTSQSWLVWWEVVSLGIGVGGHTPGWTLPPSLPPKVSFAQDFLHSPQGSYNYHRIQESSGLVTASNLSCIFPPSLIGHFRFSELRLSFQKLPVFCPKIILASLHGVISRYQLQLKGYIYYLLSFSLKS